MDPATGAQMVKAAGIIVKVTRWYSSRNTAAFEAAQDEMFREWTVEHARALNLQGARIDALEHAQRKITDDLADDPQFLKILDNYGYEAAREAIVERRRLLACAAAASLTPKLSIGQIARVERTLRELDPENVKALHELELTRADEWDGPFANDPRGAAMFQRFSRMGLSADALEAAVCVRVRLAGSIQNYGDAHIAWVTHTGADILEICALYLLGENAPALGGK